MTRKQLPKAIRQTDADLRAIAAGAFVGEEAQASEAEPRLEGFSRPAANDELPVPAVYAGYAARRRRLAQRIVDRHKTYAAVGGLFPLPIVNVAGVTAIIVRMVRQLSNLYGVPFERQRTRSTIIGLMGGAVPTGFGTATASTLAFAVPGSALVGLAVSALTAGALTRGIGLVFLEHFESVAMPPGATPIERG
ncbi:MAG TPA: YcjF family protein [Xanthobacteraceae bacterium]|nr:YcjF family protein [Xanthobacteraceae bacterium]